MKHSLRTISKSSALVDGDVVGIIAVSSPCERERFSRGVSAFTARGFKAKVALDPCASYGSTDHLFSSDSPERRVAAFHDLLRDTEVKAILAARGAYGSMEMLPLLDFDLWRAHPKPLIGLSDVTSLLVAGAQRAGVVTFHGPTIESAYSKLAPVDNHHSDYIATIEEFERALRGSPLARRALSPVGETKGAEVEGRAIGGNLSIFVSLLGTPWAPDLRDAVVFLEDTGEKPYRVHRMLLQLHLAGAFADARAVILGNFTNSDIDPCRAHAAPTLQRVFEDIARLLPCPLFRIEHFGHDARNLTVPFGVNCGIRDSHLEFLESGVLQ